MQNAEQYTVVATVPGRLEGEILRGLLLAQGVPTRISQEGAASAIGLGVGPLAEVDLLVPLSQLEEAQRILNEYHAGTFNDSFLDEEKNDP
jgi:hypothetical protein